MQLTSFTDYALRVLMYAGAVDDRLITIEETAKIFGISRAHLMKVVNLLIRAGYLKGVRGRSGGFALAESPEAINLGAVIRVTEPNFALVECFSAGNHCVIAAKCKLPGVLNKALTSFVATFDGYTLADILLPEEDFVAGEALCGLVRGPYIQTSPSEPFELPEIKKPV